MAVPKRHRSKSRQGQHRMHIHLENRALVLCEKCKKTVVPHNVCQNCGFYRGKTMVDVMSKLTTKEKKRKEKELKSA